MTIQLVQLRTNGALLLQDVAPELPWEDPEDLELRKEMAKM